MFIEADHAKNATTETTRYTAITTINIMFAIRLPLLWSYPLCLLNDIPESINIGTETTADELYIIIAIGKKTSAAAIASAGLLSLRVINGIKNIHAHIAKIATIINNTKETIKVAFDGLF